MGLRTVVLSTLIAAGGLVRSVGDARVDWEVGLVTADGGSAADIRMPSIDVARVGAERRARAAAEARLRAALGQLSLGAGRKVDAAAIARALGRAKADVDYQSNGGAVVHLTTRFIDLAEPSDAGSAPEVVLAVAAMPLEIAPMLLADGKPSPAAAARYRVGTPPASARARRARRDAAGRLVVEGDVLPVGVPLLIYVGKLQEDG